MTTERERFEAWLDGEGAVAYEGQKVNFAWAAWQAALAQPAQPVAWQPDDRTLRVLARAFRKVAPHLIDEFINRAQEALLQEQDDDNQGNGGRARRLAGESDAGHAGPAGQRNDGQHDDGAAEHGAGLLHSLAHENRSGGNAARVAEEGAVDAAPQPAPVAERFIMGGMPENAPAAQAERSTTTDGGSAKAEDESKALAGRADPPSTLSDADRPKRDAWVGGNSYEASMLRNLLAVIHGDGGHYLEEHGLDKTLEDAEHLVAEWRAGRATVEEVPREPTEAMVQAAYAISDEKRFFIDRLPDYWRAMYDAARGKP